MRCTLWSCSSICSVIFAACLPTELLLEEQGSRKRFCRATVAEQTRLLMKSGIPAHRILPEVVRRDPPRGCIDRRENVMKTAMRTAFAQALTNFPCTTIWGKVQSIFEKEWKAKVICRTFVLMIEAGIASPSFVLTGACVLAVFWRKLLI